jgi:hypothetical protein
MDRRVVLAGFPAWVVLAVVAGGVLRPAPMPVFHVEAHRMGDYQVNSGRLVWSSALMHGTRQVPLD